ncbi:MAG: hypothetical protein ACYDED_07225 [Ferrimicrobium sp.]
MRVTLHLRKLVGPGAADFFRDACALMDDPYRFLSTSHLVGHLMREIEGSLRDVLTPLAQVAGTLDEPDEEEDGPTHKEQIRSILILLGIPSDNEVGRKWLSQAGTYHRKGHRPALRAPRPLESAFSAFFDDFESILEYVLNRMEANYSWVFVRVDELASRSPAQKNDLDELLSSLPQDVVALSRFFERATDASWLPLMRRRGMFSSPPSPEPDPEQGTVNFPPWPQTQLLMHLAITCPDDVVDTVNGIPPTDNVCVNAAIVDVARALPIEKVPVLLPRLVQTLEAKYRTWLPVRLGELLGTLADASLNNAALELATALLSFEEPPPLDEGDLHAELIRSMREPLLRVDEHLYRDILQRRMPRLVQAVGTPALDMLAELLEQAIIMSSSEEMIAGHIDYSSIWCREVAPEGLSHDLGTKTHLTSTLRDSTVAYVAITPGDLHALVESLEARQWSIFRRLAFNVLRVHGPLDIALVEARLVDPEVFGDYQLRPEYERLLAAHFSGLTVEGQLAILALIDQEPDTEQYAGWVRNSRGREPTTDETTGFVEMTILGRLTPIADQLPETWRARYEQYLKTHGPHSSRALPTSGGFIGARSPTTAEELAGLDVDALIDYLASFVPSGGFQDPSKEGLASTLMEIVAVDSNRYLSFAERFAALDIEYVNGIVNGLNRAVSDGKDVNWDRALDLSEEIVHRPITSPDGYEAGDRWGWTRLEVVRLLSTGFLSTKSLQPEHGDRALAVIESVTNDPHPTPADEEQYGPPNMSPEDLSLNSVRSRALEAVIEYGMWKHRRDRDSSFEDVITIVERHLDPATDPSVAVRSVIGRNFSNLVALDRPWAESAASRIFPAKEELRHLWSAAWDGYLWRGLRSKPMWLALRDQYELAVRRVEPGNDERRQRGRDQVLGNHLVSLYWSGEIGLVDGLLADFLAVADEELRRSLIEAMGRGLVPDGPPLEEPVLQRLLALWNSRVAAARSIPSGELSAFGWWFCSSQIPLVIRLQGLRDALALSGHAEPAHQVVKCLADLSLERPRDAAELLGAMAESEDEGWRFTLWDESAAQIIKTAVASGDPGAVKLAGEAASRAAARGRAQWLEFLKTP